MEIRNEVSKKYFQADICDLYLKKKKIKFYIFIDLILFAQNRLSIL